MSKQILIDSSFLYSLNVKSARYHAEARLFTALKRADFVVPDVVLAEVTYLIKFRVGQHAMVNFVRSLRDYKLEAIAQQDIQRVITLLTTYDDAGLDFVDCCIAALAERLNITQICTFDRRDFSIIRPSHTPYFDLLP